MVSTQMLVLIVEDDPSGSDMLARGLGKHGIQSVQAGTAGEALVKLAAVPLPNAVVLDLLLPDAGGQVLLRKIRREQLPIRVAVLTGMDDPESHLDMARCPPDAIFKKPLDLAELVRWLMPP